MSGGDITIVAGGWSVRNVAIDRLCGLVFGVNDAAYHLPKPPDVVVSMDRLWSEHRWEWLRARAGATWLRRSAVQNLDTKQAIADGWLHVFDCDNQQDGFAHRKEWLNGPNSGHCALNLAWHMRPGRVFLLGFDMNRDRHGVAHWHPPHDWNPPGGATTNGKYREWAGRMKRAAMAFAAIGCEVFNVSPSSSIAAFQKMKPADYLRECNK